MIYDINCFVGHWPFRFLRHESLSEMLRIHQKAGVVGGTVGCLDSIFFNDPSEGDDQLYCMELPSDYSRTPCIQPKLPCVLNDLERYQPRAVRIYPTMHGYSLDDADLAPILAYLTQHNIRLLIQARLYVNREAYFYIPPEPELNATIALIQKYPSLKIALLGHDKTELPALADAIRHADNVFVDTSFTRSIPMETLAEKLGVEHMIFGSSHPLLCLESIRLTLAESTLSDNEKNAIFTQNYLRFMA